MAICLQRPGQVDLNGKLIVTAPHHPSISGLIAAEPEARTAQDAFLIRVRRLIDQHRALGWSGPPFDVHLLASLCGFRVNIVDRLAGGADACISGNVITVIQTARVRQRFSIAHEISHTVFPDFGTSNVPKFWSYAVEAASPVEKLCQLGAAEFLMPEREFRHHLVGEYSVELIDDIRRTFNVSLEACVRRIAQLSDGRALALVIYHGLKPAQRNQESQLDLLQLSGPQPRLRVLTCVGDMHARSVYVPTHKSIPLGSVAYRVFSTGVPETACENWIPVLPWPTCRVHAFAAKGEGPSAVMCLVEHA